MAKLLASLSDRMILFWAKSRIFLNPAHVPCWWMNNPTLGLCCEAMIGRADIEESKSNVALTHWSNLLASLLREMSHLIRLEGRGIHLKHINMPTSVYSLYCHLTDFINKTWLRDHHLHQIHLHM